MNMKGMDQLRKHVPDLRAPSGGARIGLTVLCFFALTTIYFIITDRAIKDWSIDSQIVIIALGFLWTRQFFTKKKEYQLKYKELAYRNAFGRFVLSGLAVIFAATAHAGYMNGPEIPSGWWSLVIVYIGWLMLIVGAVLWMRSILVFGADNLALLYVYYPEEGRLIDSSIYSVLRHPVYAAVLRIGIGLALLNGNAFSLFFVIFIPLGLTGWIRLVEEKELMERFGQTYLEYRQRVPAFWPRPSGMGKFLRFLITGK
jgi:protein-S-isoprenylcysteine O-methyltransferase Ste14